MDDESRKQWAPWKLGVLGPLMSARLEHGDVSEYLRAAAARVHRAPDGRDTVVSARTIEGWHYDYRRGGLSALLPKERGDKGQSRAIRAELADLLLRAKAENPRRSLRRLIKMMVRAKAAEPNELSRSSAHRLLKSAGLSWRPGRAEIQERRAFLVEHASDLWVGDALHGPLVALPNGELRKSYLLTQLDCATRFALHSYFALNEHSGAQEYGLKQAVPGLTPADLNLAQPTDLELKLKREPVPDTRKDQLNFEDQLSGQLPTTPTDTEWPPLPPIHTATDHPKAASPPPSAVAEQPNVVDSDSPVTTRAPAPLAASCTEPPAPRRPAPALAHGRGLGNARPLVPSSRGSGSCNRSPKRLAPGPGEQPLELRFPCWLLDAIIRQHRTIAEGKGPYVPIDNRDRARVDGALSGLPGRWEDNALLELCARVSGCALGDARAKGGTAANLRYTFGGRDADPDEPHKHFHRRVAELREDEEKSARERLDGELTAALLGTPKPPVKTFIRHPPRPPSSVTSTSRGAPAQPSLTPAQQAALNAQCAEAIRKKLGAPAMSRA